jgi:hypothetical protein
MQHAAVTQAHCLIGPHCVFPCLQVAVLDTGLHEQYKDHCAFAGLTVVGKNFTTNDVSLHKWHPFASWPGWFGHVHLHAMIIPDHWQVCCVA